MNLTSAELRELRIAKSILENPGLVAKLSNYVGSPLEVGLNKLPKSWGATVNDVTHRSIEKALDIALMTMSGDTLVPPSNKLHKLAVGASGAAGGAFGLTSLAIELPISTTIMLRSIADIARSEGENLGDLETKLQCVQVLALGGKSKKDDGTESGYFAARATLAKTISEASAHLAKKEFSQHGAPAIVKLISKIAARFSIVVTEKAAIQAVPVMGALGGAVINTMFIDHFQDMGRGHFIVRRLERLHGQEEVRKLYDAL